MGFLGLAGQEDRMELCTLCRGVLDSVEFCSGMSDKIVKNSQVKE